MRSAASHLSSELGFCKERRELNIRRIGFVALEIAKNGGIAICDSMRKEVRAKVGPAGGLVLSHVATPLYIGEQRDRKGSTPRPAPASLSSSQGFLTLAKFLRMLTS